MLDWILLIFAILVGLPFVVLTFECIASILPGRRPVRSENGRIPCSILIPAHNEEIGIEATLSNLRLQMQMGDRMIVIADNCTDQTAEKARLAGAEVLERHDSERRGKGYALDHGLKHLQQSAPPIVVIIDADCELAPGALDALVQQAHLTRRPAQGIYTIGTGQESDSKRRLSAFAVLLKNQIRPLGLDRMGLPVLLTGTGMAFPWEAIRSVDLGSGNIVEDMKLGVDLARMGYPPRLCPAARLSGAAAPDRGSAIKQRTRWEHGHVATILRQGPILLLDSIRKGRAYLLGLALELCVPPLSMLGLLWGISVIGCALVWHFMGEGLLPLLILWSALAAAGIALTIGWFRHGRSVLPAQSLLLVPGYVLWKLPIYLKLFVGREKKWVRTDRKSQEDSEKAL